MKEYTGINDYEGKPIHVGDTISDNAPSKGKVFKKDGFYLVTSNLDGRDINDPGSDYTNELTQDIVMYNKMVVID